MFPDRISRLWGSVALAGVVALGSTAGAITINLDGSTYPTLSAAVAAAYADDNDGPDIINITVDELTAPDGQVFLNKPITINGDAENGGIGNGIPCSILVDMTGIRGAADVGNLLKSYIEVQAAGEVNINDIRIHPNADGGFLGAANSDAQNVSGIRLFKPVNSGEVGTYNLTRVYVTGSDENNAYLRLDTGDDLYNTTGTKRWGGLNGSNDGNLAAHAAIHFSNDSTAGQGIINTVLDHCHAGLSKGLALSIPAEGGSVHVKGGVYGHCARDGIRVSGTSVTIQGTPTDRVRVVRYTNIAAANSHGIETPAGGTIPLMEYVDFAGCNTGNAMSLRDGQTSTIRFVRGLGKFGLETAQNEQVFITSAGGQNDLIEDCTFVGSGANPNPMGITAAYLYPTVFRDCIFTSENLGVVSNNVTTGIVTYDHCALPIDLEPSESLNNPPFGGSGGPSDLSAPGVISPATQSPQYLLTLADYDWSDNQGAGVIGNGPGNMNVLRPSNLAYLTAGSGGTPLTGGAGPILSGVDAGMWMLLE